MMEIRGERSPLIMYRTEEMRTMTAYVMMKRGHVGGGEGRGRVGANPPVR